MAFEPPYPPYDPTDKTGSGLKSHDQLIINLCTCQVFVRSTAQSTQHPLIQDSIDTKLWSNDGQSSSLASLIRSTIPVMCILWSRSSPIHMKSWMPRLLKGRASSSRLASWNTRWPGIIRWSKSDRLFCARLHTGLQTYSYGWRPPCGNL